MAIKIKSTAGVTAANGVKMCVYGAAGSGKTTLIRTLPRPIILSAEGGLLSIQDADLPYIEIDSMDRLKEALAWAQGSEEALGFESVALDSISEIAEVVLAKEKAEAKDPRQAYGAMQDVMGSVIRGFRDLKKKHVYFSAKVEKSQDEMGRVLYAPSMPGNKMAQSLPFYFDELLAMRVELDGDGNPQRALMAQSDGLWQAKDRSGKLRGFESPDLGTVIRTITGGA